MKIAVYPGSFDPVTLGHYDIIERTSKIFDKVILGVLNNRAKSPLFSAEERVNMLKEVTVSLTNVEVQSFEGLLIDFCTPEWRCHHCKGPARHHGFLNTNFSWPRPTG